MRHQRCLDRYKEHRGWLLFLLERLQRPVLLGFHYNNESQQRSAKVLGQMVQKRLEQGLIFRSVGVASVRDGSSVLHIQGQLRHSPFRTLCIMTGSPELLLLPTPFHQLSSLLEAQPESFISGNKEIQDAALRATEHVFNIGSPLFLQLRKPTLTSPVQL